MKLFKNKNRIKKHGFYNLNNEEHSLIISSFHVCAYKTYIHINKTGMFTLTLFIYIECAIPYELKITEIVYTEINPK